MSKDFTKLVIKKESIVKEFEKSYLIDISGATIVIAKSLMSKFQDEKHPETITFSIPVAFSFEARKTEKDADGKFVITGTYKIDASDLQARYNGI